MYNDNNREDRLLTVPEVCQRLNIGRTMLYELVNRRQIKTVKIGKKRLVSTLDIDAFIESQRC